MSKGFTIIELLLVVTLLAVFSTLLLTNLSGTSRKEVLEKASTQIVQTLRGAQNSALAGQDDSNWGVKFMNRYIPPNLDRMYLQKSNRPAFPTTQISEYRFESGISLSESMSIVYSDPPDDCSRGDEICSGSTCISGCTINFNISGSTSHYGNGTADGDSNVILTLSYQGLRQNIIVGPGPLNRIEASVVYD